MPIQTASKSWLDAIDAREKDFPNLDSTQYGYKLSGGMMGMDVPMEEDLQLDLDKMTMWVPIASGARRDGVGDLLDVTGIKTERHFKNPIVLFDHGKQVPLPIARAREDPKDPESYTFKIDPAKKSAGLRAFFYKGKDNCDPALGCKQYDHALFCEQIFHMTVDGQIRSGSIGYQIIDGEQLSPDYNKGIPQGVLLKSILMLEGSEVVLPASMDTVGKALTGGRICGKQASPYLVKALTPYKLERKVQVVGGWDKDRRTLPDLTPRHLTPPNSTIPNGTLPHSTLPQGGLHNYCNQRAVGTKDLSPAPPRKVQVSVQGHPPGCSCEKCVKELEGQKSCGCNSCSNGHTCPCEVKTKDIGDEKKPQPTAKPVSTTQSAPSSPTQGQKKKTPEQAANTGSETPGKGQEQTKKPQIINPQVVNPGVPGVVSGAVELPENYEPNLAPQQQIPPAQVPTFNPTQQQGQQTQKPASQQPQQEPIQDVLPGDAASLNAWGLYRQAYPNLSPQQRWQQFQQDHPAEAQSLVMRQQQQGQQNQQQAYQQAAHAYGTEGQGVAPTQEVVASHQAKPQTQETYRGTPPPLTPDRLAATQRNGQKPPPPLSPERLEGTLRKPSASFNPKNLHLKKADYRGLTPEQASKKAIQASIAQGASKKQAQQIAKQVVEQMKRTGNRQHRQQRNQRWTPQGPKSLGMNFHIKSLRSKYSKKEENPPARRSEKTGERHMADGINSALEKSLSSLSSRPKHLPGAKMNIEGKNLKGLRDKYKRAQGRKRLLKKGTDSHAVVHISSKDLDKLRADAEKSGVAVKWMEDDGKGLAKVKLSGHGGVIDKLAQSHGKLVSRKGKKSLMGSQVASKDFTNNSKPLGPIGTLPGTTPSRERETLQETPLTEGDMSTERPGEPESTDVLTAHKEEKNMKVKTKAADPLVNPNMPLPEEGTEDSLSHEGNPDYGATNGMGEGLDDTEDLGDMGDEEFDIEGLDEGPGEGTREGGVEPYGMQVIRRLWDDSAGLLHEYDEFMEHLEDEATRGLLQSMLEYLSSHLERLESHVSGHPRYGNFPPLGNEGEGEGEEPLGAEAEGLEPTEGSEVEASSGQRQEPTPEEALQGMAPDAAQGIPGPMKSLTREEYFARVKSLKASYKKIEEGTGAEYEKRAEGLHRNRGYGKDLEGMDGTPGETEKPEEFEHEHKKLEEAKEKKLATLVKLRKDLTDMMGSGDESPEGMEKRLGLIKKIESLVTDKAEEIPGKESEIVTGQTGKKSQPSDKADVSPEKARQILKDGTAQGHPLTQKQRGMFGAIAGKDKKVLNEGGLKSAEGKPMSKKDMLVERASLRKRWKAIKQLEAKHLEEINGEKSLISSMYKNLESKQDMKSVNEKQWLHKRFKALEKNLDPYSTEKSYIKSRFKDLNSHLKKEYDWKADKQDENTQDTVKNFAKKFNSGHKNLITEARKFLSELKSVSPMGFGDPHRQEAYHLHKSLNQLIGDVCGKGSVEAGLRNLAKALITEDMPAEPQHPAGPSKYNPKGEPLQQWEASESVVKGKTGLKGVSYEFPELAAEREEVNVTHPSSNPQAKPHDEHMPYHEGDHLPIGGVNAKGIGERGSFPEMCEEDKVVGVGDHEGASPSKYTPGKEPLQQWKESLLKGLKSIGQTSNFFKMLSYKKDFGVDDQETAGNFVLLLGPIDQLVQHLSQPIEEDLEGLEESPFGDEMGEEWMEEEAMEPEHEGSLEGVRAGEEAEEEAEEVAPVEEEAHAEEPGEIGEKKVKSLTVTTKEGSNGKMPTRPSKNGVSEKDLMDVMGDNQRQTQTLLNLQQSLQSLLSRLPG